MAPLGLNVGLRIGGRNPDPAPQWLMGALDSIQVTQTSTAPAGFQLTFLAEHHSGPSGDYQLFTSGLLAAGNRVIVTVILNGVARVLHDGFITHQQLLPANESSDQIVVTGEDVSVQMDLVEFSVEYPFMPDAAIVEMVLTKWLVLGIVPDVHPTPSSGFSFDNTPQQYATDRAYLQQLAERHGYFFFIQPGPVVGSNKAYWGPPPQGDSPQKALTVDVGPGTNVLELKFAYDHLKPRFVMGLVLNEETNLTVPISTLGSTREPLLSARPALDFTSLFQRRTFFDHQGLGVLRSYALGQAITNSSTDCVVAAEGRLDGLRYGDVLWAPGVVPVRGVGESYDGLYYVREVTHTLGRGRYEQEFKLNREGLGSTISQVAS